MRPIIIKIFIPVARTEASDYFLSFFFSFSSLQMCLSVLPICLVLTVLSFLTYFTLL